MQIRVYLVNRMMSATPAILRARKGLPPLNCIPYGNRLPSADSCRIPAAVARV
jgi:hypothetical protein